jgi:transketolase
LNIPTFKPIDKAAILKAARETGAIVTAEEHQEHGGLGSTVARIVAAENPVPVALVAVKDRWGQSGKPTELLEKYGLTAKDVAEAVRRTIGRR